MPSVPDGETVCIMSRTSPRRKTKISLLLVTLLLIAGAVAAAPSAPADDATSVTPEESQPVPPYVVENAWNGHISCGVGTIAIYWATCSTLGDANDMFLHAFDVEADIQTFVVAVDWDPTTVATGQELYIALEKKGSAVGNGNIMSVSGPPPLEFRVDDLTLQALQFRVFAGGDPAGASLQQPFTVHYHEFYGEPAPDGYSALPE